MRGGIADKEQSRAKTGKRVEEGMAGDGQQSLTLLVGDLRAKRSGDGTELAWKPGHRRPFFFLLWLKKNATLSTLGFFLLVF